MQEQEEEEEEEEIEREGKEGGFFQRYYKFSECSCYYYVIYYYCCCVPIYSALSTSGEDSKLSIIVYITSLFGIYIWYIHECFPMVDRVVVASSSIRTEVII